LNPLSTIRPATGSSRFVCGFRKKTLYVVVTVPLAVSPDCVAVNVDPTGRRIRGWPFEHRNRISASHETALAAKPVKDALPSYWHVRPVLEERTVADTSASF
jgi:hypothetical protein